SLRGDFHPVLGSTPIRLEVSVRDGPSARRRHQSNILAENPRGVSRLRHLPLLPARRELLLRKVQLNETLLGINGDRVTFLYQRYRTSCVGLWANVSNHHAPGSSRKSPVGNQTDRFTQSLSDEGGSWRQHLLHARAALGPFVTDDNYIPRLDLLRQDGLEAL